MNDYERFLAERRYQRDLTQPWLLASVAGAGLLCFLVYAALALPFAVKPGFFLNPVFAGVAVATTTAVVGLAYGSTNRALPVIMLLGLVPLTFAVVLHGRVSGTVDRITLTLFAAMSLTGLYLIFRTEPRPPRP